MADLQHMALDAAFVDIHQLPQALVVGRYAGTVCHGYQSAALAHDHLQQPFINHFFSDLDQRTGGLVGKYPARLFQKHPGHRQSLRFAARELLVPLTRDIQLRTQLRQQSMLQRLFQLLVGVIVVGAGIGQSMAQSTFREIYPGDLLH